MVASFPGILRRESFIVSFLAFFTLLLSPTKSSYTFKEPFGNFARKELIARDFAFFAIFSGSNALFFYAESLKDLRPVLSVNVSAGQGFAVLRHFNPGQHGVDLFAEKALPLDAALDPLLDASDQLVA